MTMTLTGSAPALDTMLRGGLDTLDLSPQEHSRVVSRYTGLGVVLDRHWSSTRGDNVVAPQGSFLLGTVVRNIWQGDDVDIDCVALRDVEKTSITQVGLKADVGVAARMYCRTLDSGDPLLQEWSRCWTLVWPGMHLDLLPAIPDSASGGTNLLITDREVQIWLPSNPAGYAKWFRSRMRAEYLAKRAIEAKRLEVEEVPAWRVKTTLQQTVQALKRHRDIHFAGRLDDRPSSIVVTTLAAQAYPGGGDLYDVLREVTKEMGGYLHRVNGVWVLPNPSQPSENFTDTWSRHPGAAANLFEWLEVAAEDFGGFGARSGLHNVMPLFEAAFGDRFVSGASKAYGDSLYSTRTSNRLRVTSGGATTAAGAHVASTSRPVRNHGFAGGTR